MIISRLRKEVIQHRDMKKAAPMSSRKEVIQHNEPAAYPAENSNAALPDQEQAAPLSESRTAEPLHSFIIPCRSGFVNQKGCIFMIDVSKKPTATEISYRIGLLHNLAHTAALFAMDADYNDRAAHDAMQAHIELIDELCAELDIMAQVMDDYATYADFPELIQAGCSKPKPPSEERQRVNAAIIADLEKLGVIPPAADEKAGDSE